MKHTLSLLLAFGISIPVFGQTNTNAPITMPTNGPFNLRSQFQQLSDFLLNNDPSCTAWSSNKLALAEAAVFASVKGVNGESSVGNDLIAEYVLGKGFMLDSATRFEAVFGDIASQDFGVEYNIYTKYQIRISGGCDGRYIFTRHQLKFVPNFRFEKASLALHGLGTFIEYGIPVQKNPGWGELKIGLVIPVGP